MDTPQWSLCAAGRLTGPAAELAHELLDDIAAVLAKPRYGCGLSSLHVDITPPIRVAPHLDQGDPLASACA